MNEDEPRRPVLSRLFWLSLLVAFLCIATGAVVGVYGARLFPVHSTAPRALGNPTPPL